MRFKIDSMELGQALYRVQGIAARKSSMPILAHVLIRAEEGGSLELTATDLDIGFIGRYKAEVEEPGSVAIHAKQLYEIVKSLGHSTITLGLQDNYWLEVRSGASRFRLVGMKPDDFPALPNTGTIDTFTSPAGEIKYMIEHTLFCVSTDDNRHNLSGVFCQGKENGGLRMVATDGHRLAMAEKNLDGDLNLADGVIVPRKGFQELRRILGDIEDPTSVALGFSTTNGVVHVGDMTLSTRLVEGQFPDYQQVVPSETTRSIRLSRSHFSEALKRVSLLSQGRAYGVKLAIENGGMNLIAEDPEFGDANEKIEIEYSEEPMIIGFNARYLLDALALINSDTVVLHLTDDLSPGILKPEEDEGFLAVVMPVRI
ncbi:MAG: DNA polymerase III subunit beta [Myxococcota bacterium]|nr:DNA polymerase III subunit beta [Myxococcota bacterium]